MARHARSPVHQTERGTVRSVEVLRQLGSLPAFGQHLLDVDTGSRPQLLEHRDRALSEISAINVVRRTPPGPLLALLASRPWFAHLGDLHFRFEDSEGG